MRRFLLIAFWISVVGCQRPAPGALANPPIGHEEPTTDRRDSDAGPRDADDDALLEPSELDVARSEASSDNCRTSPVCRTHGACEPDPDNDRCRVAFHADCEASEICAKRGRCTAKIDTAPADPAECVASFDADCERSEVCRDENRCSALRNRGCVEIDAPMADGWAYEQAYECHPLQRAQLTRRCMRDEAGEEKCGPQVKLCHDTAEYCAGTERCKKYGWCSPMPGYIDLGHGDDLGCSEYEAAASRCPAVVDRCGPTDEGCAAATTCRDDGNCTVQAIMARPYHEKSFLGGALSCLPDSADDCRQSKGCATDGRCGFLPGDPHPIDNPLCMPTKPEHCTESDVCKVQGRCTLRTSENPYPDPNRCVEAVP